MALTDTQFRDLQQGDLVKYFSGTDEDTHIEAEGIVVDVDDEGRLVVITLTNIKEQGILIDHARNETITVNPKDLTLVD